MDVAEAKDVVRAEIERLTPALIDISHSLHANPELNFEEHHAHEVLTGVLEDQQHRCSARRLRHANRV